MYERAARCLSERGAAGAAAARRRWLSAALVCLRLAPASHAFLARPHRAAATGAVQVIGPEELAAELREEDPDSMDPVQKALLGSESIDFDALYATLQEANAETLLAVTKRIISTGQFLPRWFLVKYMEVDAAGCIRALLSGGRVVEAGSACCQALRAALCALLPGAGPRAAPLAPADLLLAELRHHAHHPQANEVYEELKSLVKEYTDAVIRTSEDMKIAQIKHAIVN